MVFLKNNMPKYSITFLCMFLMVAGIVLVYRLTCKVFLCVVLPFISWTTSLGLYLKPFIIRLDLLTANLQ